MDIITFLIADAQPSLIEQPVKGSLDHVAVLAKPTAVRRVAFGYQRGDIALTKRLANLVFGIVGAIRKYFVWTFAASAARLFDWRDGIDQRNSHFRIVNVGAGMLNRQRGALTVHDQMAFGALLSAIRRVWARLRPPKTARTEQESNADVDQSMASAMPNSSSRTSHIFCQTPAMCQSRNRRQHVIPLPQPISCGKYSHGVPVLSTNRIPVRQARSGVRGRPPLDLGGSGGMCGLIRSHSSSVSSGLAMIAPSVLVDRVIFDQS